MVGYGAGVGDDGGFDGFCDEAEYLSGSAAVRSASKLNDPTPRQP